MEASTLNSLYSDPRKGLVYFAKDLERLALPNVETI
jgi:hypothetical protein